jgi:hypothetical protein
MWIPGTDIPVPQIPILPFKNGLYLAAEHAVDSLGYLAPFVYFSDGGPVAVQPVFVVAFWGALLLVSILCRSLVWAVGRARA